MDRLILRGPSPTASWSADFFHQESQANFEGSQGGIERPRLPTDEQSLRGFFATSFGSLDVIN